MGLRERLRSAREAAGLTQEEAARSADLSVNTVAKLEGRTKPEPNPKAETLRTIASVYGVSLDWLLTGNGHGPRGPQDCADDQGVGNG